MYLVDSNIFYFQNEFEVISYKIKFNLTCNLICILPYLNIELDLDYAVFVKIQTWLYL